jgi:hypothetical protein
MKDVLRAAERRFGVHDPVLEKKRTKKRPKSPFVLKRLKAAWKGQLAFSRLSSIQP